MTLILILCLVGCYKDTNPNIVISEKDTHIIFWTDPETGVQYIIYNNSDGYRGMGGITPRLNANGTLFISKEVK